MIRFKAGAIIYDPSNFEIVARGCSHPDVIHSKRLASIHAEHSALRSVRHLDLTGHWCVVYTLNGRGGTAWSSRPCLSCAGQLFKAGVERVVYAERTGLVWTVRSEHPEELVERAPASTGRYARQQRIPA